MYKSSDVADRLREVAKIRHTSMASVLSDCGLNFNAITHMRRSMPNAGNLAKMADRLECSVDYLLGRTEEMLTPGSGQTPVELPPPPPPAPPSPPEEELPQHAPASKTVSDMLSLFSQLPGYEQERLVGRLQLMVEQLQAGEETLGGGSGSSPAKAV